MQLKTLREISENYSSLVSALDNETFEFIKDYAGKEMYIHSNDGSESIVSFYQNGKRYTIPNVLLTEKIEAPVAYAESPENIEEINETSEEDDFYDNTEVREKNRILKVIFTHIFDWRVLIVVIVIILGIVVSQIEYKPKDKTIFEITEEENIILTREFTQLMIEQEKLKSIINEAEQLLSGNIVEVKENKRKYKENQDNMILNTNPLPE